MKYYLGLDNGGTTTKVALLDSTGKEIGVAGASTAMITPKPGFVERDMEEMWEANCRVIRDVLNKTGVSPADVAGVGICGHGKGLYLWGKDNKPVRNGIISTDNRAYEYPLRWQENGTEAEVFKLSCQHILSCQPVSLLAWIRDNEPENYRNIGWIFECKDYVRFRMTGEARAELTDYSGANLMNLNTRSYDRELLKLFGLEDVYGALPPLCRATEICGKVTGAAAERCGLLPGTPVIGGMFDIDACALAVGITDESRICMIAGTWSINEFIRKEPVLDGKVMMNSLFALPDYYLVEECSPTSAGNNEWFIKQILPEGDRNYDELNEWVESIPPEEFVPVFLPFIMGSNAHPNARASFVGMSANHTKKHLLRSVYEGAVFCHKTHVDKLLACRAEPPKSLRLAGGAAHSNVWTQMFADVMGLPVETVAVNETGAFGCALAVAVAVGDYDSIGSAVKNMCRVTGTYLPNPDKAEIYRKKFELYKETVSTLNGLWDNMQKLINI